MERAVQPEKDNQQQSATAPGARSNKVSSTPTSSRLGHLAASMNSSPLVHSLAQMKEDFQRSTRVQGLQQLAELMQPGPPAQVEQEPKPSPNRTGLPNQLKSGVENMSGIALDDLKVHYNSDKPAQLNALAYAQGTDIHVAPGQEKHLPHEAWHIVQQKQGRVRPTMQMKSGVPVNDDQSLEKEADVMGGKATKSTAPSPLPVDNEPLQCKLTISNPGVEVLQGAFRVTPTDFDPVANAVIHSTFTNAEFASVLANLAGQAGLFRAELVKPMNNPAHANFTFAFIDANIADQPDLPSLSAAIITAICGANAAAVPRLMAHAGQLTRLLGMWAPTRAGAGDVAHFRSIAGAVGVALSRTKAAPSTVPYASLAAVSAGAYNAVTNRRNEIVNKNNELDNVANYIAAEWAPRGRAGGGMNQIRSPHTNNAGWLPARVAATGPTEAAILAAALVRGNVLRLTQDAWRIRVGGRLVNFHASANRASDVEEAVNISDIPDFRNLFYRSVFWPNVATKADRVQVAWARYAEEFGVPNGAYIEFNGGGAAARVIWDYVADRYYISAHYNWVDGYNPHFEVTGLAASY